ncbi:exported protein of unknown function [Candidatus Filomicrobium marinum]|uniref:Uncharacterized protein n=2 Tax=Filomicrobium TaxID=119044 RepID=A0A0D6JJD3_9HYPH|nr:MULTISPECIES: hypothetical protein [Filomicrobium]CFX30676.1 exported protein of unknown function [Candidatus Filomicrobium marinum]CPR22068.1 exported protein of unknown function [Candidatus Filomicrobium marinum]SDP44546.1 hypothetical protein SAMN04488061_3018 [Filomicrobium insigne]
MTNSLRHILLTARKWGGAAVISAIAASSQALAQNAPSMEQPNEWGAGISVDQPDPADQSSTNTTIIKRSAPAPAEASNDENDALDNVAQVRFVAMLTADGQYIDKGVTWRIFEDPGDWQVSPKLIETHRTARPSLQLKPGKYIVNAAFGRANLTRNLTFKGGDTATERFIINAGGLRVQARVADKNATENTVSFDIYEGERNQLGERNLVMSGATPNVIIRLNAGIYHIISTYGDSNAVIATDVTVEAGKLTEATLSHAAAKVTLGLVTRPGGEAQPATQWTIATPEGEVIKRSVGALPTHILAPGTYKVTANHAGRIFEQQFQVEDGQMARIEVLMQ